MYVTMYSSGKHNASISDERRVSYGNEVARMAFLGCAGSKVSETMHGHGLELGTGMICLLAIYYSHRSST